MSFNFVAVVTICSDFGAQENKGLLSPQPPTYTDFIYFLTATNNSKQVEAPCPLSGWEEENQWGMEGISLRQMETYSNKHLLRLSCNESTESNLSVGYTATPKSTYGMEKYLWKVVNRQMAVCITQKFLMRKVISQFPPSLPWGLTYQPILLTKDLSFIS